MISGCAPWRLCSRGLCRAGLVRCGCCRRAQRAGRVASSRPTTSPLLAALRATGCLYLALARSRVKVCTVGAQKFKRGSQLAERQLLQGRHGKRCSAGDGSKHSKVGSQPKKSRSRARGRGGAQDGLDGLHALQQRLVHRLLQQPAVVLQGACATPRTKCCSLCAWARATIRPNWSQRPEPHRTHRAAGWSGTRGAP